MCRCTPGVNAAHSSGVLVVAGSKKVPAGSRLLGMVLQLTPALHTAVKGSRGLLASTLRGQRCLTRARDHLCCVSRCLVIAPVVRGAACLALVDLSAALVELSTTFVGALCASFAKLCSLALR